MGYIYSILNTVSNKAYIGKCVDYNKRFKEHIRKLKSNNHHNRHLQNAWNKYEEKNFEFFVLIDVLDKEMDLYEILFIKIFNTNNQNFGYNLTNGGDGVLGYRHSIDYINSLKKPRPNLSGEKHPYYNKKHTEEIKKINNGMYGKKHSEETKKKISSKMKNINKGKNKKTISNNQILLIKEMLEKGYTQVEISKKLNIPQPKISLIKNNKY